MGAITYEPTKGIGPTPEPKDCATATACNNPAPKPLCSSGTKRELIPRFKMLSKILFSISSPSPLAIFLISSTVTLSSRNFFTKS